MTGSTTMAATGDFPLPCQHTYTGCGCGQHTYTGCGCGRPQQITALVPKVPHRCPVCYGTGHVDNGFYNRTTPSWSTGSTEFEPCRSCDATGVVWA